MSYQVVDTTAGLDQAMKLLGPSLRGMPGRHRFLASYERLVRHMAMLVALMDDGEAYFNEDAKAVRKHKTAAKATKAAKEAVKAVA